MVQRYTGVAIVLHWVIALFVTANITLAWVWEYLPDAQVRPAIDLHKSIGITVLGLAILRVLWRVTHRPPLLPVGYARWERGASHLVHWLLYAIIIVMPLSGWIMDSAYEKAATTPLYLFGVLHWPRIGFVLHLAPDVRDRVHAVFSAAHGLIAYAIYALVALHILGAVKHQWLDGTRELQRMWPKRR